jgi:hypothetical protein
MTERRQEDRFHTENAVQLLEAPPTGELFVDDPSFSPELETLDLSPGGCLLFAPRAVPLRKEFCFSIQLQDHVVTVKGRAVRQRRGMHLGRQGWKVGVQFTDVDPMDHDGIALYLRESGADVA